MVSWIQHLVVTVSIAIATGVIHAPSILPNPVTGGVVIVKPVK